MNNYSLKYYEGIFSFRAIFFFVIALGTFSSCEVMRVNEVKIKKTKDIAVVSIVCKKTFTNRWRMGEAGHYSIPIFEAVRANMDTMKLDSFANHISKECSGKLFFNAPFNVLKCDSVANTKGYDTLPTMDYLGLHGWYAVTPKSYRFISTNQDSFNKLKEIYPDVEGFAFIDVEYYKRVIGPTQTLFNCSLNSDTISGMKVGCSYRVTIYDREGILILDCITKDYYSDITIPTKARLPLFSNLFDPKYAKPFLFTAETLPALNEADKKAFQDLVIKLNRKFSTMQ